MARGCMAVAGILISALCFGQIAPPYDSIIRQFDRPTLEKRISQIAAFGSRLAGSEGEARTLEFLEQELKALGFVHVRREPFEVTVPDPDARGTLSGRGWQVKVLPLWPNLVRSSTCHLEGKLLYGKSGSLEDLSGKDVAGAIVLLEFESGENWKNAFSLGARAVLFLEPDDMRRNEAEAKFSSAPLNAPRFYLPIDKAEPVLRAAYNSDRVRLECQQDWVTRRTYNLLADAPSRAASAERLVVACAVDAMSVVPARALGGSGIATLAAWLELARRAADDPKGRPMTFVAVSAQSLGLQGWREYAERRIREQENQFLHLTLDLNDGNDRLGVFGRGWYADYRNETLDPLRTLTRSLRTHADALAPFFKKSSGRFVLLDTVNDSDARNWRNTIYGKVAFGCEPLNMAGIPSITLATVENERERADTPFDTAHRLDLDRILRQTQVAACLLWHLRHDTSNLGEPSARKVSLRLTKPRRQSLTGGSSIIEGEVVQFDPNRSFIPDIAMNGALAVVLHPSKTMSGVRGPMIQRVSGPNAHYRFLGIPPSNAYFHLEPRTTTLAAYVLDPATGDINAAPSVEVMGHGQETSFTLVTSYRSIPLVTFRCSPIDLYGLTDPQELVPLYTFGLLDPKADATPRNYSMALPCFDPKYYTEYESNAVLFVEPESRFKLLMGNGPGEWRLILLGSSADAPQGQGYPASSGTLQNVPLLTATDLIHLNASRLQAFASYRILSPVLTELQEKALAAKALAETAQEQRNWPEAEKAARAAWGLALRAHPMIQGTVNDVVSGVLFYLALLIPFSYFAERLVFARRSLTAQLFTAIGIFIAAFLALRAIHPAFEIVSNPSMIFVAFVMGVLSVLVATFIIGKFESSLRDIRARQSGVGHVDVGRMSVAMAAFHLGIANMRRRKARTILTTSTLVVMTFIVLSFTSFVPELSISEMPSDHAPTYPGILVRNPGLEPLQETGYAAVQNEFANEAKLVRRSWFYGAEIGESAVLTLASESSSTDVRAIAGMDPGEQGVTDIRRAILPGGRWFEPGDEGVILIPFSIAEKLHLGGRDVGKAQLEFSGHNLTVIGILSDSALQGILDLDGESILPADFALSKKYQSESGSTSQAFRKFLRLDPSTVFIAPSNWVQSLGGQVRSVAVRFNDPSRVRGALDALMPRLRKNLYAAVPSGSGQLEVKQFSVLQTSKGAGLGLIAVQMILAAVFVLNTMVASVYERRREIGIFSSIGLAPNHIAVLFFAESCVYGVLGAVIGYFLAQGVARLVIVTGWLPGLYLNFSASSAVASALIVLAVVLLSTIYPAKVAGRIAAPAYEAEITSEPQGDLWTILLPFRVHSDEAESLMAFFRDWLRGYEEHAVGEIVTAETRMEKTALHSTVWIAPFDLGVSQRALFESSPLPIGDVVEFTITLTRLSGEPENWKTVNKRFLTQVRRQFLAWRTKPQASSAFRTGEVN